MSNRIEESDFNEFVGKYKRKLLIVIYHFVNDWDVAEDILQDSLLKGFLHSDRFKRNASWYTFFYRICVNNSISYLRRKKFKKWLPSEWFDRVEAKRPKIINELIERENYERIRKASEKLPAKQKKVFILKNFEELGYREISEILEITEGATRSHYFQALKKIRKIIQGRPS